MDEQKVNSLINIGQSKVAEKAYDDLVSPPSKKAGNALSTIVDMGNTVLWPIKWLNERTRIYFENNLKKYEKKLETIAEEKIVTIPSEISKPILDRFTYVSNEELSNAFVNLLTSASSSDTISFAHPGFIAIIDRLSSDEAKILNYLEKNEAIPRIDIMRKDFEKETFCYTVFKGTNLKNEIDLTFPDNSSLYLDNLASLGLIENHTEYYSDFTEKYKVLETSFQEVYNEYKLEGDTDIQHHKRKKVEKSMYSTTEYGKLFIKSCIK